MNNITSFVAAQGISYPVGVGSFESMSEEFDFNYLPHGVLIDGDGKVLWSGNLYCYDLEEAVEDTFGAPARNLEIPAPISTTTLASMVDCDSGVCVPK